MSLRQRAPSPRQRAPIKTCVLVEMCQVHSVTSSFPFFLLALTVIMIYNNDKTYVFRVYINYSSAVLLPNHIHNHHISPHGSGGLFEEHLAGSLDADVCLLLHSTHHLLWLRSVYAPSGAFTSQLITTGGLFAKGTCALFFSALHISFCYAVLQQGAFLRGRREVSKKRCFSCAGTIAHTY